ncbi:MAG: hypothetical protein OFPI_20660 [Osedax symbiont Rs2]|nr:MAG: hypothetical protein OFPI_20660 [Osedax symbiont Rs2]
MQGKERRISERAMDLEKIIANRFNRLLWRISNYGERDELAAHKISLLEWRILAQLGKLGRMPIGKLSELSGVGPTVGSRAIKSLKLKGCVESRKSTKDSRQQLVQLTDYGLQVHDAIAPNRQKAHQQVQAGLSPDELSTMLALCDKLERHLDRLNCEEDDGW